MLAFTLSLSALSTLFDQAGENATQLDTLVTADVESHGC